MRSLEEIIKEIQARQMRVNNLFQLDDTGREWQANLRHTSGFYDFGRGQSPVEALEDALSRAKNEQGPENRPIPKTPAKIANEGLDALL